MQCFGEYTSNAQCKKCEYLTSCQLWQQTNKDMQLHITHIHGSPERNIADWHTPDKEVEFLEEHTEEVISLIGEFVNFIMSLDEYSLAIIQCILTFKDDNCEQHCTVRTIAEKFGVSRWAMHKKILKMIYTHPELYEIFSPIIYKLSSARRRMMTNNKKNNQKNDN